MVSVCRGMASPVAVPTGTEEGQVDDGEPRTGLQAPVDPLGALFTEHYGALVRLAGLLVDDRATAEDVVQDAFVRLHGRLHRVTPGKEPAYLRSIVLNGARSHLRQTQRRGRPRGTGPETTAPPAETSGLERHRDDVVLRAVRGLSPRQRSVLLLRFYVGLTEQEVAETLGISVGSVKTHSRRGFAALAPVLEELR